MPACGAFSIVPLIAAAIWSAAKAIPIQYRQLLETRRCRALLIQLGIEGAALLYPDWLRRVKKGTLNVASMILKRDLPENGLHAGDFGTVVYVYNRDSGGAFRYGCKQHFGHHFAC